MLETPVDILITIGAFVCLLVGICAVCLVGFLTLLALDETQKFLRNRLKVRMAQHRKTPEISDDWAKAFQADIQSGRHVHIPEPLPANGWMSDEAVQYAQEDAERTRLEKIKQEADIELLRQKLTKPSSSDDTEVYPFNMKFGDPSEGVVGPDGVLYLVPDESKGEAIDSRGDYPA